jgi:hypothetical protein
MSEIELQADYAQPADLTRVFAVARIAIAAIALAAAVWLAFDNQDKYRRWAETIFQAKLEASAATEERDQAVAERNAAIAELEDLRAGKAVEGLGGAGLTRVDGYLAAIEKRTDGLRELSVGREPIAPDRLLAELNAIRETAGEARKYLQTSGEPGTGEPPLGDAAPPRDAAPGLRPSTWIPDEAPARLIPASLNTAAAPAAPPAVETAPTLVPQTRFYIVLGMLGLLGLTFLIAVVAVFTTRNARKHAFATDTIKTLLGFFIGVVTAFMGTPA